MYGFVDLSTENRSKKIYFFGWEIEILKTALKKTFTLKKKLTVTPSTQKEKLNIFKKYNRLGKFVVKINVKLHKLIILFREICQYRIFKYYYLIIIVYIITFYSLNSTFLHVMI